MPFAVTADVERFDEAVDWFLTRTVMTAEQAQGVSASARRDAFWVGGSLQLDQVQRVFDKITKAIETGETFEEFRLRVASELRNPAHIETVFRNATQRAYNAGRWQQMRQTDVLKFRPYWLFDAILDSRTTTICKACNKTLLHADDPWWDGHIPPLHHRCRSSVRNLRRAEAEKRGITKAPPENEPDGDWGAPPTGVGWKPDLENYDARLAAELERKKKLADAPVVGTPHEPEKWTEHYAPRYGVAAQSLGWGRASLEHGLDLPIAEVRALLEKLPATEAKTGLLASLEGAEGTLRASGGQLDPARKAAAAVAGHISGVGERPRLVIDGLAQSDDAARRAQEFFGVMTRASVIHPQGWTFRVVPSRASMVPNQRLVTYQSTPGILEHEWGHALESLNPTLLERALEFLAVRTRGERLRRLSDLTGMQWFLPSELARPDGFVDAYIGKDYRGKATELTSMGVEILAAGNTAWGRLDGLTEKDLEHLLFTLGQLAGP